MIEMKRTTLKISSFAALIAVGLFTASCKDDLLELQPTTELGSTAYWKTEADATSARMEKASTRERAVTSLMPWLSVNAIFSRKVD